MERSIENVILVIVAAIEQAQACMANEPVPIRASTRPHLDVAGFDSLAGVMVTVQCLERLGIGDCCKLQNLFVETITPGVPCAISVEAAARQLLGSIHQE